MLTQFKGKNHSYVMQNRCVLFASEFAEMHRNAFVGRRPVSARPAGGLIASAPQAPNRIKEDPGKRGKKVKKEGRGREEGRGTQMEKKILRKLLVV